MAEAVDQIRTAIPGRRFRRVRCEGLVIEEQEFPAADETADVERKFYIMIAHFAGHRLQCFQVGEKIADILHLAMRVGGEGKRRIIMLSGGRRAFGHRSDELGFGPVADAVVLMR